MTTAADTYAPAVQYPVRWFGYPTAGSPRRIKPTILLVVHITGNSNLPSAINEATYSNRDGSGASFTFVTNRDGSIVQCLKPLTQTPWTNGDVMNPNMALPTVAAACDGNPYNMNEFCFMTCENVGYEPTGYPLTSAQQETLAQLAAWGSRVSGLPVNRNTVLGHRDINSISRFNCPTSGDLNNLLGWIIKRANEILSATNPLPDTAATEEVVVIVQEKFAQDRRFNVVAPVAVTGFSLDFSTGKLAQSIAPVNFSTDSWATASQRITVDGVPYLFVTTGGFAKSLIREVPDHIVLQPVPAVDCSSEIASAVAPLNTQIATLQSQVTSLNSRLDGVKTKVATLNADVAND